MDSPNDARFWLVERPHSPLGQVLGFVRLSLASVLALGGIAALYVLGSELAKRVSYARAGSQPGMIGASRCVCS